MTDTTFRNRHYRGHTNSDSYHVYVNYATFVAISEALGGHPEGSSLEEVIADIDARLTFLENAVASTGSFLIDATMLKTVAASLTADAYLATSGTGNGSFTIDAINRALITGSFTADAIRRAVFADAITADATVLATLSDSLTADAWLTDGSALYGFSADAITKKTFKTGRMTIRYGTIQTQANAGTYTQNMNVGSNPKALGIYILGAQSGSMASFSTWTFNATDTISFRVLKEFLSTRVYLFDNITPSAMSGVVEVKAVVTGSVGTFSFVPFAIETDETVSRLDTDVDGGAGNSTLYSFDTGANKAVGLIGRAGTDGTTNGLTSFFSSPSGYDAGYETAAPQVGSRSIGFTINGSHAWVGVAYGLGDIGTLTPILVDAVILDTQSGSFTVDAVIDPMHISASFTADANVKATEASSFTIDAFIALTNGFTIDAYIASQYPVDPLWAYENAWAQDDAVLEDSTLDTISEYERNN